MPGPGNYVTEKHHDFCPGHKILNWDSQSYPERIQLSATYLIVFYVGRTVTRYSHKFYKESDHFFVFVSCNGN